MTVCISLQADREQLTQLAFEEFNMTGFFLCDQPVCSLYAVGKITGTVIDVGYAKTGRCHNLTVVCMRAPMNACAPFMCPQPGLLQELASVQKC